MRDADLQVRALGSFEVSVAGVPVPIPAAKERWALAALCVRAGEVLGVDTLLDVLWGDEPPRTAAKTLQTYVSALRRLLPPGTIETRPPGYTLQVARDSLDTARFERMVADGRRAVDLGDASRGAATLREALALWRGPRAYDEFADHPFFIGESARLAELRLSVVEDRLAAELATGAHAALVGEIEALLAEHQLRERLWAQLMVALYRSGRQADALHAYQRARHLLAEQLGIDPGPELQRLEQAILAQDPSLDRIDRVAQATTDHQDLEMPTTRYAVLGDLHLAYQVVGDGPRDLLYIPDWWSHVDVIWEHPVPRAFLTRLASSNRLVLFDSRGTGLSDPVSRTDRLTLEDWVEDANVVLDAVGSPRAIVFASSTGATMSILLAATCPERLHALVVVNPMIVMADTLPGRAGYDEALRRMKKSWGAGPGFAEVLPHMAEDAGFAAWFARAQRLGISPGQLDKRLQMFWDSDVRDVARTVTAPTLILHRRDNPIVPVAQARELASLIPGARLVELDGDDHFWAAGDTHQLLAEVEAFLAGAEPPPPPERALSTVLATRVTGSGADRFMKQVDRQLERHNGRRAQSGGETFLCTFEGPARAIACGQAFLDSARQVGLDAACGLHTGEAQRSASTVRGVSVVIAEFAARLAAPGQLVVSRTIVDLVAGSDHRFEAHSESEVEGAGGAWSFFLADP